MQKKYDYLVYIGRFQPFHNGHKHVISKALEKANNVIVVIGSVREALTCKNPFTDQERSYMIEGTFEKNVHCVFQDNIAENDKEWALSVNSLVLDTVLKEWKAGPVKIGIVGHQKDFETTDYLNLFPFWDYVEITNHEGINATDVRKEWFENNDPKYFEKVLPPSSLRLIKGNTNYLSIKKEYEYYKDYKKAWEKSPYPPTFVTADAAVIWRNELLLIKRKNIPGKNLLALPGGFVNPDETTYEASIRELKEETSLDLSEYNHDYGYILKDRPNRSLRGRVLSHVYIYDVSDFYNKRPEPIAGDDAFQCHWVKKDTLGIAYLFSKSHFFEDHYETVDNILNCRYTLSI